jgi:hypothetical protein
MAKKPTMTVRLRKSVWGTWRRRLTTLVLAFSAISGGGAAIAAYERYEPIMPALHYYVRWEVAAHTDGLLKRIIEIQLAQNDTHRQRLIDEAAKREVELQGDQAKQLPQYRALVQQRVDRIKAELSGIDKQDKSLFDEKKSK